MILLTTLSVIEHLICGSNELAVNLNQIYKTLWRNVGS